MNPARVAANMLTKTQLAGYLSRCPRRAELAYRLRYCQDDSVRHELYGFLMSKSADIAIEEGWPLVKGKHYLENMVQLALDETRNHIPGDNWQVRANKVGVRKADWERVWRSKYATVFGEVNDWCNQAFRSVWSMQK